MLRCVVNLLRTWTTLILVSEVEDDLRKVLLGEGLKDLGLSLRIIRNVAILLGCYETNFFMDSMSIFFSSIIITQ